MKTSTIAILNFLTLVLQVKYQKLTQLLDYVQTHKIDKVLVYECSRLSRRAVDFLAIIEMLTNLKVSVFVLQNGLETLLPNGQENPLANMVLGILAHFNSVERSVLRSRMTSGYNQFRAKGGKVGRKIGSTKRYQQTTRSQ